MKRVDAMGIRLKPKRKIEDTVVGKITNAMAVLKVRNNMTIQMDRMKNSKSAHTHKRYSLYSARIESGLFS